MKQVLVAYVHRAKLTLQSDRGFGFIVILPQVILLGGLAAMLSQSTLRDLRLMNLEVAQYQSELSSEAVIFAEIFRRLLGQEVGSTSNDNLGDIGPALRSKVTVQRESAKISVNRISNPILQRLLTDLCIKRASLPSGQAEALTMVPTHEGTPTVVRVRTLSEIRRRLSLSSEAYLRIKPYITNYGFHDQPDLQNADPTVIQATLGLNSERVNQLRSSQEAVEKVFDRTGILSITSQVSEEGRPARKTRAVVYLTGMPAEPFRILEVNRDELEPPGSGCIAKSNERAAGQ